MEMTKKRLEAYMSEKQEIEELKHKLQNLKVEDYVGNSVIMDYRSGYPVPQSIVGTDLRTYYARKEHLISEISRLEQRCQEVEQWIDKIPDSIYRRIFRMYYEDGKKQREIAATLYIDQSNVNKKIKYYLSENISE